MEQTNYLTVNVLQIFMDPYLCGICHVTAMHWISWKLPCLLYSNESNTFSGSSS